MLSWPKEKRYTLLRALIPVLWLASSVTVNHAAETHPARGAARRLNRAEYNYSVRDLLGVNLQPAADPTGLSHPTSLHARHNFPADAEYAFQATVGGSELPGSEVHMAAWIDGEEIATLDGITGHKLEMRAHVTAGEHTVSLSYLRLGRTGRINLLEIDGPFDLATGPDERCRKLLYTCGHLDGRHEPGCGRKIVGDCAHRAFRRPVTPAEVERLTSLAAMAQARGASFEEGLTVAIQAILVSPNFLFHLKSESLAARLSYFLWSSIPDDELLALEEKGRLRSPAVLAAQVRRMLRDPKAVRLARNFGGQWLGTRRLDTVKPDGEKFPGFDDHLRYSMRCETDLFFENLIREDGGILDFLNARYSFLNGRLAVLYGIPGVTGPEFRKVDLTGTPRGGVLTQASVLTVSSSATRTSPVLRGKWILENLLNSPPLPPLPDVPNLDETIVGASASMRQELDRHRTDAVCASCHARMDPLGFGLENFNAIGEWRTQDGPFPVDASGALPDGRHFQGALELKAALAAKPEVFTRSLTEKLLIFALGRGLEASDRPAVANIVKRVAAGGYRFSALILEIARLDADRA